MLAVPAHEGLLSAKLGGTSSLGYRRAPGACRPVGNGWVGHIAIAGHRPRSGASRRRASLSRPCTSQQGWPRSVVWVSSQRKLAEYRAAVPQLRQGSLAGGSACAVEAPPSSQTASHAAPAQGRAGPQRVPRPGFGGKIADKKPHSGKRLRLRRDHPWAVSPRERLMLGALQGSMGAIRQYLWNGATCSTGQNTYRTANIHR